jgi:spore photoproduct lyase
MWGNDHGLLDALSSFAYRNPAVVLELKTKSARTDWVGKITLPPNVLATWSLNAPTIIEKEEHLTATLSQRLRAARKVADSGLLVGFHLHPMVYFKGWENEYGEVVRQITTLFKPEEVALISLGTLTFTKPVLRQLRSSGKATRILEMELVESAGKFSYPVAVKQRLFSQVMESFPTAWKKGDGPFFYLCMELPELWEPVLHRSYPNNAAFEEDMRKAYTSRIADRIAKILG